MDLTEIILWDGVEDARLREVWAPAPNGYGCNYLVSSFGRVLRITGGPGTQIGEGQVCRLKAAPPDKKGYPLINLYKSGKRWTVRLHQLVLRTFEGPPPHDEFGEYEGGHVKPDLLNCRLDNLEWQTAKENREEQWHRYYTEGVANP